ncbi:MAG: hypothetical protein PF574_10010 [Candidatus Delongbacteria bacterium]|jgi:hypothetical protein|nr:hypothetical protein [Candidatus Delongbacteria bacterium]
MKMLYINFNISTLPAIMKIINDNGIHDYQIVDKALSINRKGDPRLDNAVWPGYNSLIFIPCKNNEKADLVLKNIKLHNKNAFTDDEIITACKWDIEEYIYE